MSCVTTSASVAAFKNERKLSISGMRLALLRPFDRYGWIRTYRQDHSAWVTIGWLKCAGAKRFSSLRYASPPRCRAACSPWSVSFPTPPKDGVTTPHPPVFRHTSEYFYGSLLFPWFIRFLLRAKIHKMIHNRLDFKGFYFIRFSFSDNFSDSLKTHNTYNQVNNTQEWKTLHEKTRF